MVSQSTLISFATFSGPYGTLAAMSGWSFAVLLYGPNLKESAHTCCASWSSMALMNSLASRRFLAPLTTFIVTPSAMAPSFG